MSRKKEITTNYREAWLAFQKSKQYKELAETLAAKHIAAPYAANIIELSFAAGWNASGAVIKIISK